MRISLNGNDWLFKAFLGEDWVWRNSEKPDTRDLRWWYPGTVPGSVHHDLLQLGDIPDPYFERNSLLVEWVPDRTWIYKKAFTADPAWQGRRVTLHFEGIDYSAQIFLNGKPLGKHKGTYIPAEFEVGEALHYGQENLLAVVIDRAPDEEPQVSKTEYVHTHKSRMTYWWDFCPRMIHVGIWDDVYLEVSGTAKVTDLWVRPQLSADLSHADLAIAATFDNAEGCEAELLITREGEEVAQSTQRVTGNALSLTLSVENPALWWPAGHGEQPLYQAELRLFAPQEAESVSQASLEAGPQTERQAGLLPDQQGTPSHSKRVTFGIRRIEAVQNEGAPADSLAYTLIVNGQKLYIRGWNWVPIDVMYGVPRPEKLERLLQLAVRANVNLLRVWGGGLIEKELFYDLCDRYGILVWQEFILSSSGIANKPSTKPEYLQMMAQEAEIIIPKRRNHPSLAIWCGGNELYDHDGRPLTDEEPVLGLLHETVRRLDPDRHWLPTSASGPESSLTIETIERNPTGLHDVHGPWEHQGLTAQYTLYNRSTAQLHSEFGAEGMASPKAIAATIAPEHQWPAGRENRIYFDRGSWWNNEVLVQSCFGGIKDVVTLSHASQFLQHEALRYALEANRRRQWQNAGSIPWQFNEPFPNAWCTSSVDYYAEPKGGYWAVARAYAPLAVTARFDSQVWGEYELFAAQLWLASILSEAEIGLTLTARLVGASGKEYRAETLIVSAAANGANQVGEISCPVGQITEAIFFLDLLLIDATGRPIAENRYLFTTGKDLAPLLAQLATALTVTGGPEGFLTIRNTGKTTALNIRLDDGRALADPGWAYFSANLFSLLPGEERMVLVEWSSTATVKRVELKGWNTEVVTVG